MLLRTPFHDRVAAANQTSLWSHWAGHLVVERYQMSEKWEYTAIRNAVGVFDSSPLYKYRITGPDAERYLATVLSRDIRTCRPGQAHYTIWCDDRGFVNEDGVVYRLSDDDFLLTAAQPNLAHLSQLINGRRVDITDVSPEFGILAVQGPRSRAVLAELTADVDRLGYFDHITTRLGDLDADVTLARTGFTGDLGYEILVPTDDPAAATRVWDLLFEAGRDHGIVPFGQTALLMARIEAGLLLIDVDFEPSRLAENDEHRSTPDELGLGWMLRDLDGDPDNDGNARKFIGREAILRERRDGTSRWVMRGLLVDPIDHEDKYHRAGMIPPRDHLPVHDDMMVYDNTGERVGYATSFLYSPVLQRHIALARIRPDHADPGTGVNLEFTINHRYVQVRADVARNPLFNPPRKSAPTGPAPTGVPQ
ncbi:MAG: aminomethyltransferase family protein [Acidimicrobiia bacterium]|nr:aminomethyltransferase family protein [Acidimicrobiia bacterium]